MPGFSRRPAPHAQAEGYRQLPLPASAQDDYASYPAQTSSQGHAAPPYSSLEPPDAPVHAQQWSHLYAPDNRAHRDGSASINPPGLSRSEHPGLPLFEAALARARGTEPPMQPLPSYAPPPDPNHPDLSVGLQASNTIRMAIGDVTDPYRSLSRSPSPDLHEDGWRHRPDGFPVPSITEQSIRSTSDALHNRHMLDQRLDTLGLLTADEGDLSLPPFRGRIDDDLVGPGGMRLEKHAFPDSPEGASGPDLTASTTQHYGPAPVGRVDRRTHNAAGGRRIRHTATLDENGFFAVDMPIPTRLAQFLPFKGVEEQKCTR